MRRPSGDYWLDGSWRGMVGVRAGQGPSCRDQGRKQQNKVYIHVGD